MVSAFEIHRFMGIGKPVNFVVISCFPSLPVKDERTVIYIVPAKNGCGTAYNVHTVFFCERRQESFRPLSIFISN